MNKISQNVQVILTVDPTMQGNDGTEKMSRYGCRTMTDTPPCFTMVEFCPGCKLPWAASTHKVALQLGKEKNWTARKISHASIGLQTSTCDLYQFNMQGFPDTAVSLYRLYGARGKQFWSKLNYSDVD